MLDCSLSSIFATVPKPVNHSKTYVRGRQSSWKNSFNISYLCVAFFSKFYTVLDIHSLLYYVFMATSNFYWLLQSTYFMTHTSYITEISYIVIITHIASRCVHCRVEELQGFWSVNIGVTDWWVWQPDEVAECYIWKRNVLLRVEESCFWTSCRRQEFTMKRNSPMLARSIEL